LETKVVYCDDNLHRLSQFPSECVDLIYLDPPFFSNRHYEVIWGDEAEVRSFEDRWDGGIQVYVAWMRERMMEMHRILKPTGSIYLHCDWHASHYLKVMMDGIFGEGQFQNEVIWHYRGGGVSKKRWGRRHDSLLFYAKGKTWTFNPDPVRTPYSPETMARLKYKAKSFRGDKVYDQYEAHEGGKHPDDVLQIQPIMPSDKRRLGYPTQKPEELLRQVILASSNPGDIVLDPFAGCGTTMVVAQAQNRPWIGIDISPTAVGLMKQRVERAGARDVKLVGMPVTPAQLRELKPFEFQNWVIQRFNGTHSPKKTGDMGVDGYSFMTHDPIQVKRSDNVGRNVVDNFETAVEREGKTTGYIVAFSFTRGAKEEAARVQAVKGLTIKLITVDQMLVDTSELVTPVAESLFSDAEAPLPARRTAEAMPSPDELIDSDRAGTDT